ncbi:MAG: ATP-binding cassette domain-containing protein [Gemmatimonas sp.]|nr:ATP-binding cassette domain-containing protein [Gemmatimonas sp.]
MQPTLTLRGVSKRYADHVAVESLGFTVPAGTIYGILGPNGAGKSTTLRMIMNIIARDVGEISLLGRDPAEHPALLKQVGYLPEDRGLYRKMRVIDTIVFFGRLKGLTAREARRRAGEWLERLGLGEWGNATVDTLSKGMQQKVQFIATVLHDPPVLILDEPFSGLDPVNQDVLLDTVKQAKEAGRTVLFSTHIMEQAERICDQICIIAEGQKVLEGGVREVRRQEAGNRYQIEFETEPAGLDSLLHDRRRFDRAVRSNGSWEVDLTDGTEPRDLLIELTRMEPTLLRFVRVEPTLHQIFVNRVGAAATAHRKGQVADA